MYMKITKKRLNQIRNMKRQSARKYKKGGKKKRRRTLRSRKVNLKKRTIRYKMKGGDKIQDAIDSYTKQISNLKKRLSFLEKRQQKIKSDMLNKKNELLRKRGVNSIKELQDTDKTVLKNYVLLKRENQKEIDSIPVKISNIEILIQRIKRDAMNAQFVNTIQKANLLKKKGIDKIKNIPKSVDSEINVGVTMPKVVTTVIKTLKDNKGKILSPGYMVDVIQDPDGVSASTGTAILSNASSREKSIIPKKSATVNKSIKDIVPPELAPSAPPIETPIPINTPIQTITSDQSLPKASLPIAPVVSISEPATIETSRRQRVTKKRNKTNTNSSSRNKSKSKQKKRQKPKSKKKNSAASKGKKTQITKKKKAAKTKKKLNVNSKRLKQIILHLKKSNTEKLLKKLKVRNYNKKKNAKELKEMIIKRYETMKNDNLYNILKSINQTNKKKKIIIRKGDSKIKMLTSYINFLKKRTLKNK
jgi:hypothetical protein